jgi:hypothetical protein
VRPARRTRARAATRDAVVAAAPDPAFDFPVVPRPGGQSVLFGVTGEITSPTGGLVSAVGERHTGQGYLKFDPRWLGSKFHGIRLPEGGVLTALSYVFQVHSYLMGPGNELPAPEVGVTCESSRQDWFVGLGGIQLPGPTALPDGRVVPTPFMTEGTAALPDGGVLFQPNDTLYICLDGWAAKEWYCWLETFFIAWLKPTA